MSLTAVSITTTDFDTIYHHMASHNPRYANMHLREARQRAGKRVLRYLHAMRIAPGKRRKIEGALSGPGLFCHYEIIETQGRTQLNVMHERGSTKELDRLQRRFLKEILARVASEQGAPNRYFPKYTSGQFYLRRRKPGSDLSSRSCTSALSAKELDARFLSKLKVWDLELLYP